MEHNLFGVSVLMPCLNEEKTVGACVEAAKQFLAEHNLPGEILVVDNGSTDASADVAKKSGAKVIFVPERGYGNALRAGIQEAAYSFIVFADCDGSYNFLELKPFYDALVQGTDVVIGNRFRGKIERGAMPWMHHYFGNPVLSWLGRKIGGAPLGDFHCGMRGVRKEAMISLQLCTTRMEFASEMIVKAAKAGLNLKEIPCNLYKDKRGRASHLRPIRDGIRHARFLLRFAWLKNKKKRG